MDLLSCLFIFSLMKENKKFTIVFTRNVETLWLLDQALKLCTLDNCHTTTPLDIAVGLPLKERFPCPQSCCPDNTVSALDKLDYNPDVPFTSVPFVTLNQNEASGLNQRFSFLVVDVFLEGSLCTPRSIGSTLHPCSNGDTVHSSLNPCFQLHQNRLPATDWVDQTS